MQRLLVALSIPLLLGLVPPAAAADEPAADYDLARMEGLSWVLLQLKQDYVDPTRVKPSKMLEEVLDYLERRVSEVEIGLDGGRARVQVGAEVSEFEVGQPGTVWEMNYNLQPIFAYIAEQLDSETDPKDVEFAAVNGMLSTLDPHSNLLPPELFREMQLKTTGEFGGLGIRITIRKGALTIISPLPDTPAARLGLKAMDQIVRIGDESTVNMPLDEAVNLLRGKAGTKVTIWVQRSGWAEPHKYVITRETIRVRSVISKLLEGKIGYIQLQDFTRHTGGDVLRHLAQLKREAGGLEGLVLDLRNNAGGLMKAAVQAADLFLDQGIIVATVAYGEDSTPEDRYQKRREEKRASEDGVELDLPIVVLINSGSASASEILAGALKNLDRAVLMGEQTFGKGTVQILNDRVPPSIDGACLKLTVAEYLIPGDISIQEIGVTPDIELLPVQLDADDLQVFCQPERFREEDIPEHLKKKRAAVSNKPSYELRFLEEVAPEPEEGEELPIEEPGYKEDFQIRLARDMLRRVDTPRGAAMLDEGKAFIEQMRQREMGKMVEGMEALGVDWSTGAAEGATGEARFELIGDDGAAGGAARADSEVRLKLEVRNTGAAPFSRLRAESRCPAGLFDRREFLFGRVEPGQSRSWEVPVKIPRGVATRTEQLRFLFFAEAGQAPAPLDTRISIQGLDRPAFGFSWRARDPKGNGDGLIQPGERIELDLTVHNLGAGSSFEAKALLKNEAGKDLFIQSNGGRLVFGEIAAQAAMTKAFRFRVRADTERDALPVEVTIWDSALGTTQVARIELPVQAAAAKPTALRTGLKVTRDQAAVRGGAAVAAPLVARAARGSLLLADARLGDWYRLAGAKDEPGAGWIHRATVERVAARRAKAAGAAALKPFIQHTPPRIALETKPQFYEQGESITLRGRVHDDDSAIRDVAVWVGSDKIHLLAGSKMRNPRDFPLEVEVPLEPGPNHITIIAREGQHFAAHRSLVITRPGGLEEERDEDDELMQVPIRP